MATLDFIVIGLFALALIGIIIWVLKQKQNNSADYFLGGRDATWLAIGASIFASNIGSEHLIGLAGFSMLLTSGKGSTRTIALTDKIPVERNKATLVRIYVLGDNVFTTGVDFDVEVDTVWDGSNFVDGEID